MGSRALIYMKTPDGWVQKYSHWGASHLLEGLTNKKFWRKGDNNAIRPVLRSAKGYLDGRWTKMKEPIHDFVADFDIEAILIYEKPQKGKIPDKAILIAPETPVNDVPTGGFFVLDMITSPLPCYGDTIGALTYPIRGAIEYAYGSKKVPRDKRVALIRKLLNLPSLQYFSKQFTADGFVAFVSAHEQYPLDLLLAMAEPIRRGKAKTLTLLEELARMVV